MGFSNSKSSISGTIEINQQNFDNINLIYKLFWVDENVNKEDENILFQKQLYAISDIVQTFDHYEKFENEIKQNYYSTGQYKIFLIISEQFGKEIVPKIHNYESILTIHIFDTNRNLHDNEWINLYPKVNC